MKIEMPLESYKEMLVDAYKGCAFETYYINDWDKYCEVIDNWVKNFNNLNNTFFKSIEECVEYIIENGVIE